MFLMEQHQEGLQRRLFAIGIPRHLIMPLVAEWVKWEHHSGPEWTTKRLKSLKVDLFRRKSGEAPLTWIRKNRHGDIRGVLGALFRWSDKSEGNFGKCVQACMAYTFYVRDSVSPNQMKKFITAVECPPEDGLTNQFHWEFGQFVKEEIGQRSIDTVASSLLVYRGSPTKRAPRLFRQRSVNQDSSVLDDLQLFNTPGGHWLYTRYHNLYSPLLRGIGSRQVFLEAMYSNYLDHQSHGWSAQKESIPSGRIAFIQEPGMKLRSVASPYRAHQEALRPLGEAILNLVSSVEWDCTHNQAKALPFIQSHLARGGRVHSVDLSSATDYFPLSLQKTALLSIFGSMSEHVMLFEELSRGDWCLPSGKTIRWSRGQPLGLYPSFGSFTLTHGLLLRFLSQGPYKHNFFVLGDDVVILEDDLYAAYISMLDRMHCPWSTEKSITSSKLSEFAGKIVTSTRVIPQLKWRNMSDDNFLDLCRLIGAQSRSLLSARQKVVFDRVMYLCTPFGLGFNPQGIPLTERIEQTSRYLPSDEVVLGALMGLRRLLHQRVYEAHEDINRHEAEGILTTFDQKVQLALSQTVFSQWELVAHMLDGLATVPVARDVRPRLPTLNLPPSRVTTLERYEQIEVHRGACLSQG